MGSQLPAVATILGVAVTLVGAADPCARFTGITLPFSCRYRAAARLPTYKVPEDLLACTAGPGCDRKNLSSSLSTESPKLFVALTTIPPRAGPMLQRSVDSIFRQHRLPDKVIVSAAAQYKRFGNASVDLSRLTHPSPRLERLSHCEDRGPGTKLLCALPRLRQLLVESSDYNSEPGSTTRRGMSARARSAGRARDADPRQQPEPRQGAGGGRRERLHSVMGRLPSPPVPADGTTGPSAPDRLQQSVSSRVNLGGGRERRRAPVGERAFAVLLDDDLKYKRCACIELHAFITRNVACIHHACMLPIYAWLPSAHASHLLPIYACICATVLGACRWALEWLERAIRDDPNDERLAYSYECAHSYSTPTLTRPSV